MTLHDIEALELFIQKHPTWWWTIGHCDLTRDFSCAPQAHSPEMKRADAVAGSVWDEGFHCDHTGSIADAIHDVLKQIGEVNNV